MVNDPLRQTLEIAAGMRGSIRYKAYPGEEHKLYLEALNEIRRLDARIESLQAQLLDLATKAHHD